MDRKFSHWQISANACRRRVISNSGVHGPSYIGGALVPLLFLLYINDVVDVFCDKKCTCKLYADDL